MTTIVFNFKSAAQKPDSSALYASSNPQANHRVEMIVQISPLRNYGQKQDNFMSLHGADVL